MSWKNLDLAIPQVVFGIAGGYYIYQAVIALWRNSVDSLETPVSSIFSIMTGVILVGVAIVFQQIGKYRERKRSTTITVLSSARANNILPWRKNALFKHV